MFNVPPLKPYRDIATLLIKLCLELLSPSNMWKPRCCKLTKLWQSVVHPLGISKHDLSLSMPMTTTCCWRCLLFSRLQRPLNFKLKLCPAATPMIKLLLGFSPLNLCMLAVNFTNTTANMDHLYCSKLAFICCKFLWPLLFARSRLSLSPSLPTLLDHPNLFFVMKNIWTTSKILVITASLIGSLIYIVFSLFIMRVHHTSNSQPYKYNVHHSSLKSQLLVHLDFIEAFNHRMHLTNYCSI